MAMLWTFCSGIVGIFRAHPNASTRTILSAISINIGKVNHLKQWTNADKAYLYRLSPKVRKAFEAVKGHVPNHPPSPYARFMKQVRPTVSAQHPHLKLVETVKLISKQWRELDVKEKEVFSSEYRKDWQKYSEEMLEYHRTLSADDEQRINAILAESDSKQLEKSYRQLERNSNKPKKPSAAFIRFLHGHSDRQANEGYKDYIKRKALTWNAFSETEKKKYDTSPEDWDKYKKAMKAWEKKITKALQLK